MIIHNNSTLKAWLKESGVHESHGHAHDDTHFDVDEAEFRRELSESAARHPSMSAHNLEIRAAYHLLRKPRREAKRDKASAPVAADTTKIEKLLLAVVILLSICLVTIFAGLAKGDPAPKPFVNESRIRAAVVEAMAEPVGGIVIQLQNGGTTLATRGGGLVVFNCTGAGLTCSFSGSTFTMNGSGGAGTGCIPPGTTANAVLFDAGAGACSDVSKLTWNSVTSTITLATGGVFDPTAGTVKVPGTTGQLLFNNGGNLGAEDPIVSGPTAIGSAPSTNPVFVAGWDGTNIRALTLLNSAPAGTEYGLVTRNIPNGTQTVSVSGTPNVSVTNTPAVTSAQLPAALDGSGFFKVHEQGTAAISAASLPLPTGAATAAKQPAIGTAGTPSADVITVQGVTSMTALKVDGSGVTQPVSGTVTANAGTGTFTVGQATGTNLHMVCDSGCSAGGAFTDNSAFTAGTTAESNVGGVFNDGLAAVTSGNGAAARITAQRALHVNLRNNSGTEIGTSTTPIQVSLANTAANATAVKVDNSGVTQPVSGTVTVTQSTASNLKVDLSGTAANATAIKVDGSAVTQPVSGTVTANLGTTPDPCGPGQAKSYKFYDNSTSGATELVALSSGKVIYVCSYSFSSSSSTANTLSLVYGTGTNCATGQTAMTPGIILQAAASTGPIGKVNPNSAGLQTAASNALCILRSAAVAAQAEVSYVQQ